MKHDWEYKKLGEVCDFERGLTYSKNDESSFPTENKVFRSNNVDLETKKIVLDDLKYLVSDFVIPDTKMVKPQTILMCMSNGSMQHVGKVAHIEETYDAAFGGFMGLLIPKLNYCSKYLFYFLNSSTYRHFLLSIANGINITNLKFSDLRNLNIPVPPLHIQEQIVSELDKVSEIIEKKKQQVKELDNLAQSIFYDMFGDPVENEKGWEVRRLGEIGSLARGISKHRPRNAPELLGGTMPLIQTGDVSNSGMYITEYHSTYSEIGVRQSRAWQSGTLCITIAANIGKCSILTFEACFPDSVVGFIPKERICIEYMYFVFGAIQKTLEDNAMGVAQKNINLGILNQLLIAVPPLPLQQSFAQKIEAIEKQKELITASIKEAQTLFDARMDYWFGE